MKHIDITPEDIESYDSSFQVVRLTSPLSVIVPKEYDCIVRHSGRTIPTESEVMYINNGARFPQGTEIIYQLTDSLAGKIVGDEVRLIYTGFLWANSEGFNFSSQRSSFGREAFGGGLQYPNIIINYLSDYEFKLLSNQTQLPKLLGWINRLM